MADEAKATISYPAKNPYDAFIYSRNSRKQNQQQNKKLRQNQNQTQNQNQKQQQQQQQTQQSVSLPVLPHSSVVPSSSPHRPVKHPEVAAASRRQVLYPPDAAPVHGSDAVPPWLQAQSAGVAPSDGCCFPRKRRFDEILQDSEGRGSLDATKTLRIDDGVDGSGVSCDRSGVGGCVSDKSSGEKKTNFYERQSGRGETCSGFHSRGASSIPSTKVLEGILDNLQKKDTYGVFSKPVDEAEVPEYYSVIKEPMDFGTIREKLLKGDYAVLELFKKDVFLICSNAMHFNGPRTIYFKQARSIHNAACRAFNELERQMPGLDNCSKITKKLRAFGAKHSSKSSPTCNIVQQADSENKSRSTPVISRGSLSKNSSVKNAVSKRVCKIMEEDSRVEGTLMKGKEAQRLAAVLEYHRHSYQQAPACLSSVSKSFQQLMPMGLQQEFSYARSLASFGADFKSEAWKYVASRIRRALPSDRRFGPGWVAENNMRGCDNLLEETQVPKGEMHESSKSVAGRSDQCGTMDMAHASLLTHAANDSHDSGYKIFPTIKNSAPLVHSIFRDSSEASTLVTFADTISQNSGIEKKSQYKDSCQTVEQSACRGSGDSTGLLSHRLEENNCAANSVGSRCQLLNANMCNMEISFQARNMKGVNEANRCLATAENSSGESATAQKGETIEKHKPVAKRRPCCNPNFEDAVLSRGNFGIEHQYSLANRSNEVFDAPVFASMPAIGESAVSNIPSVLKWGQSQVQRSDVDILQEGQKHRLDDFGQSSQKHSWNMEPFASLRGDVQAFPKLAHFQRGLLTLPDSIIRSKTGYLETVESSPFLLAENSEQQSVSHPSTYRSWQSFAPQNLTGQYSGPAFTSSNSNPSYPFPVTPQTLKEISSQQPNLALQL